MPSFRPLRDGAEAEPCASRMRSDKGSQNGLQRMTARNEE